MVQGKYSSTQGEEKILIGTREEQVEDSNSCTSVVLMVEVGVGERRGLSIEMDIYHPSSSIHTTAILYEYDVIYVTATKLGSLSLDINVVLANNSAALRYLYRMRKWKEARERSLTIDHGSLIGPSHEAIAIRSNGETKRE